VTSSFTALGVPDALAERLARRGIAEPFPIQAATLADALAGRDVCGRAPTGSGKTLAFGIPLVTRVGRGRPGRPRGLVLVPTRELANQVRDEVALLAGRKGPSVVTLFGGVGFGQQLSALRRGVDIAVACPGRLADLVARGDVALDDVELVVLDEADRMADMGFLPEVKRLLDRVRPDRQTLLFSATLDGDVDVLVRRYQRRPVRHEVAVEEDEPQSRHVFWRIARDERVDLLASVLGRQWPAIVFCRTKRGADRLAQRLGRLGVAAAAIHGDRSQNQREAALASFTAGKVQALVATDVAARGIHVDDVACVVHFDPPGDEKDYVHRSGRTGRAGRTGLVVSLVGGDQVADVRTIQRTLGLPMGFTAPDVPGLDHGDDRDGDDRPVSRTFKGPDTVADLAGTVAPARPGGTRGRSHARPAGAPSTSRRPRRRPKSAASAASATSAAQAAPARSAGPSSDRSSDRSPDRTSGAPAARSKRSARPGHPGDPKPKAGRGAGSGSTPAGGSSRGPSGPSKRAARPTHPANRKPKAASGRGSSARATGRPAARSGR
jgi:superfamily II DNA/RNA helicase